MEFERFAAIADIHGNSDALAAVLADIDHLGVMRIVNLGDHVSGPMAARETMDMLMSCDMISISGNHDRWVVAKPLPEMGRSDRAARSQLDDRHVDWLRALPATRTLADGAIFLCHGTPSSDTSYWTETVGADGAVSLRAADEIEAEAHEVSSSLILCAHTHMPRILRLSGGRLLVNPGSVGCPAYEDDEPVPHVVETGNPNASYAILEKGRLGWQVTVRSIPYDTSRMAGLAEAAGRLEWARAVGTGRVRS
jgi:predicted phosphodiesterase